MGSRELVKGSPAEVDVVVRGELEVDGVDSEAQDS